jgi:formamidopyrimidine-DNA glycosylase
MPELPEVETFLRDLEPDLRGRTIVAAQVFWERSIAAPAATEFPTRLQGRRFAGFARRGKYMLFTLQQADVPDSADETLIVHLRMTGRLSIEPAGSSGDAHTHVILDLDDGRRLHFRDPRKFGRLWLVGDASDVIAKLGPEPDDPQFTTALLAQRLAGRSAPIKALLLDQRIVAGVGNIYADEALFAARIHPRRAGGNLSMEEVERLHAAIRDVLGRAVAQMGSSLGAGSTNYRRPGGEIGGFQEEHQVFRRTGLPCLRCGHPIERIIVGQRSTHFCPQCQPEA